ncbi:sugar ABC transporter permease [Bacillus sp. EB106-08-02-XG196]|jgi:raffinose/stachyose/melibiose transport system permease protein|uniref:carbohydrate ABC transporter permease n=1 Tax=Bacillus sp. EB106-08-02-XG196 TaxID=2737049 RepID=UPI0015C45B37|nr:sugar ABC transporter permease [Bacillus sp. EB106-08-02-XG196]NWQ41888.1 sugar ABC transporter permease [Bacillus sp. EB106-08-02-XG196]
MHILQKNKLAILIGLVPALLIYLIFSIIPILISIYYSFMDWNGFGPMEFVGFQNFIDIAKDPIFWKSVKNNIFVVIASVFGQIPIALGLALLLNRKLKGAKIFRTIGFMPVVISTVVISLTWNMLLNSEFGFVNQLLKMIGLESWAQNWLGDPNLAMISVCITIIWQFVGLYFIIFLAALQNVPGEVLEAAEIDGASGWKRTLFITIPMIWDTIILAVILCISGSLKTFDLIYVMTNGGPAHSTEVMAIYMYEKTFSSMKYGYGSAVSLYIFAFSLLLIWITKMVLQRKSK